MITPDNAASVHAATMMRLDVIGAELARLRSTFFNSPPPDRPNPRCPAGSAGNAAAGSPAAAPSSRRRLRACRVCGCTDDNACITAAGPCWWVGPSLCSGCAP